jgi:hypothetical protein
MGRPDRQLCDQNSKIFAENLSCLRAASGRWGIVVWTVACLLQVISLLRLRASRPWGWPSGRLIIYTQFPYLMNARPDPGRLTSKRLSLNYELALRSSTPRRESTSSEQLQQSSHIWFWKENMKLDHWESSRWAAETSRRMQAGTEASRCRGRFGLESTSSGWMMLCLSGVRTVWHIVRTAGTMDRWASGWDDTSSRQLVGNRNP